MRSDKRILAIIPARGGSKGLPKKNIRELCGKPLIGYAIEALRHSVYDIEIIISTDSKEIADVGERYGVKTVFRPAELATDTALVKDAMIYTLKYLRGIGKEYDCVLLIEPTSPLRESIDIDKSLDMFLSDEKNDCLATFSRLIHPVTRLWKIENNEPIVYLEGANPFKPRQKQEYAYYMNGLVYVFNVTTLLHNMSETLFVGKQVALVTEREVVDIDNEFDFFLAEQILSYYKHKKQ